MLKDLFFPPLHLDSLVTDKSLAFYDGLVRMLEERCKNIGKGGAFDRRKAALLDAAPSRALVIRAMSDASFIRPLIDLWRTSEKFLQAVPPDEKILNHIQRLTLDTTRHRLTRLALRELCMFFFMCYDVLPDVASLGSFLQGQLSLYRQSELMFGLDCLIPCMSDMLTAEGYQFLASLTAREHIPLADMAARYGIPRHGCRFFERSQQAYYILRLKALEPNAEDPLLTEVRQEQVYTKYIRDKCRLGHEVIAILIDKLREAGQAPCELWIDTILAIGGDPRLPRSARSFQMWWMVQGEARLQCMYEWLSKIDLELFLQICRGYINDKNRDDMLRMYPAREEFLRGLFRKKLIRQTRLFLGYNVQNYVERYYQGRKKLFSTKITGQPDLAVFYLDLGNAHIVEGTFSFTLKIMDRIPPTSVLAAYDDSVQVRLLGKGLEEDYAGAFHSVHNLFCYRHDPSGRWRYEAVNALISLGVGITTADVVSASAFYRRYQ